MKKLVSILLNLVLLISGFYLTSCTYIFVGDAVKWSVAQETATCGMKPIARKTISGNLLQSNCCHDENWSFWGDSLYSPSTNQVVQVAKSFVQMYIVPASFGIDIVNPVRFFATNFYPPQLISFTAVRLAKICVFRN